MTSYNTELLRKIFENSLKNLGLSLIQAKDWINSRLVEQGIEYSYEQLYRFKNIGAGKAYSRKKLNKPMLRNLAQIGFFWNQEQGRPYGVEEIENAITPEPDYNQPQLSLLELQEIDELRKRLDKLSPQGKIAVLAGHPQEITVSQGIVTDYTRHGKLSELTREGNNMPESTEDFYKLRNWLVESLNLQGRPGQPRTVAQENGYKGRLGENLNLLFEGDRQVSLGREDYIALSFILLKIRGWNDSQPLILPDFNHYRGDWSAMLYDLRRKNGQPASL